MINNRIKRAWADAVGADADSLDDWPVERIVVLAECLEAILTAGYCRFPTEMCAACGECEACVAIDVAREAAIRELNNLLDTTEATEGSG